MCVQMGTTVERDLKTLRTSKLMNSPEFKTMMVVLEKYHKEQMSAQKRKENRELDLRPFLYDDGDTYEKPFYNILLKMLYEVASFRSNEKQREDLLKVFEWFKLNQKLFNGQSDHDKNGEMIGSGCKKETEMPKLYLRPKSADGNFSCSSKETSDVVGDRETHSRSALGAYEDDEKISDGKHYNPLDRISISLKVLPLNVKPTKREYTWSEQKESESYAKSTKQNMRSFIPIQKMGNNPTISLPSSFVLKPFNHTPPPMPTAVSSPIMSPRLISPSLSPRSSPILRCHSPLPASQGRSSLVERPRAWGPNQRNKVESSSSKANNVNSKTSFQKSKSPMQQEHEDLNVDGVKINDISNTNLVTDEEGDLFQNQMMQRLQQQTRAKGMEILDDLRADTEILEEERGTLEAQLILEHERYLEDRLDSEQDKKHQRINVENGTLFTDQKHKDSPLSRDIPVPLVNSYDLSSHRPLSATMFRDQGLRVESVLDMVQPVGHQMNYEREMKMRQRDTCIWDQESVSRDQLPIYRTQRIRSTPAYYNNFTDETSQTKSMENNPSLKQTEPKLDPERKANDYMVHFPHQSNREPVIKDFKTSGPVSPDTIRYQWTDDGFGNRTYMKKRTPKETPTGKSSKRSAKHDVSMTTGERGLDKRTVASLMIIRHLGTTHRREREYPMFSLDESIDSIPSQDEKTDDEPKQNVEYLPFWKHVPSKKGLTILNIPEKPELPEKTASPGLNESTNCLRGLMNSTPSPQQVINEMFTSLTPKRRPLILGKGGHETLSVNAQSISPASRQPASKLNQASKKSGFIPAPSRPSSARRAPSPSPSSRDHHNEGGSTFSVKDFSHFCCDDDFELLDDYSRQREIWAAVNIQRIFRGHMARQYAISLRQAERERRRKAAVSLQSTFRGYLARKKMLKENMINYKASVRDLQWARDYKEKLNEKEVMRNRRNKGTLRKQNLLLEKQQEQMMGVTASDVIHEIFNRPKLSKAVMRTAAITIQRYFRGWYVRKSLRTVKEKALKRTFSFNKFIKSYQDLILRVQKRYNIEDPNTALQFHELQEYVDRLYKYEIAFGKIAENGVLKYEDILKYFAECGHHPSEKEIDDAIALVTKDTPQGRNLTKAEAVEVVFQIYVPKGTGLSLADVRKSTWMNPLISGQDVTKLLNKKDLKFTSLDKCLSLIADAQGDRSEVKNLLRPPSPGILNVVELANENENPGTVKSSSRKQRSRPSSAQVPGGGNFILSRAQYHPVKPSGNKQGKRRSASPKVRK